MKWLELKLDTSPAGLDPVSQLLEEQGITGLVLSLIHISEPTRH